jgi:hypothetical protein
MEDLLENLISRSSWGVVAANHFHAADLIWLVVVLFLLGALYLLFVVQNYVGAAVAVVLAIVVAIFFAA